MLTPVSTCRQAVGHDTVTKAHSIACGAFRLLNSREKHKSWARPTCGCQREQQLFRRIRWAAAPQRTAKLCRTRYAAISASVRPPSSLPAPSDQPSDRRKASSSAGSPSTAPPRGSAAAAVRLPAW